MGEQSFKPYSKKSSSAGRWWGFNRISGALDGKETAYMTRAWVGRLRLHIFHRGDQDPDCHDHPWGFWTFPLRSYVEEVLEDRFEVIRIPDESPCIVFDEEGRPEFLDQLSDHTELTIKRSYYVRVFRVVKAFQWNYRPATYRHRVLGAWDGTGSGRLFDTPGVIEKANVPTIVWREKPSRDWGFTKQRNGIWCWVPWVDYVYNGGKAAPCQDERTPK